MIRIFTIGFILFGCTPWNKPEEVVTYVGVDDHCPPVEVYTKDGKDITNELYTQIDLSRKECKSWYGSRYCLLKLREIGERNYQAICGLR